MLNNTGNVFGLLYTAGRRSPQENLIEARGASSGVSDRLVGAGNTVVNFSSGGVAGGLARGGVMILMALRLILASENQSMKMFIFCRRQIAPIQLLKRSL